MEKREKDHDSESNGNGHWFLGDAQGVLTKSAPWPCGGFTPWLGSSSLDKSLLSSRWSYPELGKVATKLQLTACGCALECTWYMVGVSGLPRILTTDCGFALSSLVFVILK